MECLLKNFGLDRVIWSLTKTDVSIDSSAYKSRNTFYKSVFCLIYMSFHGWAKFFKGIYSASYK